VAKDNTVAIGDRLWQIDKTRFRSTLAGSTVTIHEHLDGNVSIRFGPHVVGRFDSKGEKLIDPSKAKRGGKGGSMGAGENQKRVSTGSHPPLEISPKARDSHFPTVPTTAAVVSKKTAKAKAKAKPKDKEAA
jgi:hypothetical protein